MSDRTYFRLALGLPVIMPGALTLVGTAFRAAAPSPFPSSVEAVFLFSLAFGGVPYLVFAAGAWWAIGVVGARRLRTLLWSLPVAFAALLFILTTVSGFWRAATYAYVKLATFLAGWALVMGSFYVMVAMAGYASAARRGYIRPSEDGG